MKKPNKKGVVTQTINNALAVNTQNERLYNLLKQRTEELIESEEKLQIANKEIECYRIVIVVAICAFATLYAVLFFNYFMK